MKEATRLAALGGKSPLDPVSDQGLCRAAAVHVSAVAELCLLRSPAVEQGDRKSLKQQRLRPPCAAS